MGIEHVSAGRDLPDDINVVIEIPMLAPPVKYEVDKASGAIFVDRFMATAMHYPCNYGYIPGTLSADGDPADVLVISPVPLIPGVVVRCRPVALLAMEDENGEDAKLLAVPVDALCGLYRKVRGPEDVEPGLLDRIGHFFSHYKDLEPGKFVRIGGWSDADAAKAEIRACAANYQRSQQTPAA